MRNSICIAFLGGKNCVKLAVMNWSWKKFDDLSAAELFDIFELRQNVFVIEQTCVYPDIDQLDKTAWHLSGYRDSILVAYLRMMPVDKDKPFSSLGRIVTAPQVRGEGLGKELFSIGVKFAKEHYPNHPIKISAQTHLEKFYAEFGFNKVSEPYDEDGIMHIDMLYTQSD